MVATNAGTLHSLVAGTSRCGEGISNKSMNREDCGSKEEVGGSIPGCEISSRLDRILVHVVDCLMYFGVGMSAFCLQKK